jgi:hypothetical protein
MATADGSWVLWTVAGIVGIWVAVALISLLAPDMVTGSEQQHLAVAAFGTWVWGLIATILGITLPVVETGLDPTRLPIGAMVAPIAATLLTALAGIAAGVLSRPPEPD